MVIFLLPTPYSSHDLLSLFGSYTHPVSSFMNSLHPEDTFLSQSPPPFKTPLKKCFAQGDRQDFVQMTLSVFQAPEILLSLARILIH